MANLFINVASVASGDLAKPLKDAGVRVIGADSYFMGEDYTDKNGAIDEAHTLGERPPTCSIEVSKMGYTKVRVNSPVRWVTSELLPGDMLGGYWTELKAFTLYKV